MFCTLDFLSGFCCAGVPNAFLIANFYLILVEFGATYNNILFSANKWYETETSATSRRAVK